MKRYIVLLWLVVNSFSVEAQEREIHGSVYAFNKFPLKNVKVHAKKSKQEILTDENGSFSLDIRKHDILVFEAKAFEKYMYKINNTDKEIRINLIYNDRQQNKELAIKEGYINREDLEYGLENLQGENNIYSNFIDVFDAIRHEIPAVQILNVGGMRVVQIRGPKSVTGVTYALFIVNGIPIDDISYINPSEITSIRQLTSAQAAIYGSRAGGGVIVINTK